MTAGALEALRERGLRVPADVGLVGFDDLPYDVDLVGFDGHSPAAPGSRSLTTIVQPAYELGSTGATRLIQRLQHPESQTRQEVILMHRLRIGDSARRPERRV